MREFRMIIVKMIMLACIALAANTALASAPQLINYQGYVSNAQGQGKSGTANLSFEIYDAPTGGTKTWGAQVFNNVPLVNGYFNVILGTTDQNGKAIDEAFSSSTAFLQVYDNGTPILPRQQILSSAYAIKASHADTVGNGELNLYQSNVGIGITQPAQRLEVAGDIKLQNKIYFGDACYEPRPFYMCSANFQGGASQDHMLIPADTGRSCQVHGYNQDDTVVFLTTCK